MSNQLKVISKYMNRKRIKNIFRLTSIYTYNNKFGSKQKLCSFIPYAFWQHTTFQTPYTVDDYLLRLK